MITKILFILYGRECHMIKSCDIISRHGDFCFPAMERPGHCVRQRVRIHDHHGPAAKALYCINRITVQNVQKLLILAVLASSVASILNAN